MSTVLAIHHAHAEHRALLGGALTALRRAWARYTLERAIADVADTGEQDYREFGLDRAEMLTALRRLRDEIRVDGALAGRSGRRRDGQLAIVVTKRNPEARAGS